MESLDYLREAKRIIENQIAEAEKQTQNPISTTDDDRISDSKKVRPKIHYNFYECTVHFCSPDSAG